MKKLLLLMLALELVVCGCGGNKTTTTANTSTSGNWEAKLTGGTEQASLTNFVVSFSVTNSGPLDITGFSFINDGKCFATGVNSESETGSASFTTASTGAVTGTLNLAINGLNPAGNVLTLTGALTGTSNGTTTTTGTLTNGVVVGTWMLTGGAGDPSCSQQSGSFVMCENASACTTTGS